MSQKSQKNELKIYETYKGSCCIFKWRIFCHRTIERGQLLYIVLRRKSISVTDYIRHHLLHRYAMSMSMTSLFFSLLSDICEWLYPSQSVLVKTTVRYERLSVVWLNIHEYLESKAMVRYQRFWNMYSIHIMLISNVSLLLLFLNIFLYLFHIKK